MGQTFTGQKPDVLPDRGSLQPLKGPQTRVIRPADMVQTAVKRRQKRTELSEFWLILYPWEKKNEIVMELKRQLIHRNRIRSEKLLKKGLLKIKVRGKNAEAFFDFY